jgi:DNA polymerase III subunit alpha, Gram-positive type
MPRFPNLVSNSLLINETIDLLVSIGGRASAINVVDHVMKIRTADAELARLLVLDLIDRDPRLRLDGDAVELAVTDDDGLRLADTGFVVFDLETTGAKAPPCRITEVGAYRVAGGMIVDEFHSLVNPEMPIPAFITSLTGISDEMVSDAPLFSEIVCDLLEFIGDSVLVAHNARFDIGFLNYEIGRIFADCRMRNPAICTVQLARKLLPQIRNHRLRTVAEHFSIDLVNHHRASDDARATANIFVNLLADLQTRGMHDLGAVQRFSNRKRHARKKGAAAAEPAAAGYPLNPA